jgi:ketosteroid isomerase-like protein
VRKTILTLCALAVAAVLVPVASAKPAPTFANPTAAAQPLVQRFFSLIQRKDVAGLATFLSPAFQVVRADGTSSGKADYLKNLPDVKTFVISSLFATQTGGALVVRYRAQVTGTVNGKPYTPGPAPRLSVFTWNGRQWQLAAHSNFNPLTG